MAYSVASFILLKGSCYRITGWMAPAVTQAQMLRTWTAETQWDTGRNKHMVCWKVDLVEIDEPPLLKLDLLPEGCWMVTLLTKEGDKWKDLGEENNKFILGYSWVWPLCSVFWGICLYNKWNYRHDTKGEDMTRMEERTYPCIHQYLCIQQQQTRTSWFFGKKKKLYRECT